MLHAERSICEGDGEATTVLGTIVVHVIPDYRTLPFITSQSPYFEVFRSGGGAPAEGTTGSEIATVIYGWGLTPLYASGAVAWPISEELFARIYSSRDAFWTVIARRNSRWHVYVSNDRSGIYAIGYPALTLFDRLVHLAELTTLAGAAYVLVLLGDGRLHARRRASVRASGERCCGRSAPASTASCSSRSCSRRSFRSSRSRS